MAGDIGENGPRQSVAAGDFGEWKIDSRFAGEWKRVEGGRLRIAHGHRFPLLCSLKEVVNRD